MHCITITQKVESWAVCRQEVASNTGLWLAAASDRLIVIISLSRQENGKRPLKSVAKWNWSCGLSVERREHAVAKIAKALLCASGNDQRW